MGSANEYRIKAAELIARATRENDRALRADYENLARSYLRLAEQAERNKKIDVSCEIPLPKTGKIDLEC